MKDNALDLDDLPDEAPERLKAYQTARAAQSEREMVEAALAVPPKERTSVQEAAIAYSKYGTAAGHP